jgi:plasmid stability protein
MKNVTVSLDDATYRAARMKAAEAGRSLSALVREFLQQLGSGETEFERLHREELELRQKLLQQPTGFSASDRLSRDELYDRARARREHDEASGRRD